MFRLAGHLGCTVAELEQRLSSSELTEWVALAWLDPWGEYRADVLGLWLHGLLWLHGHHSQKFRTFYHQIHVQSQNQKV